MPSTTKAASTWRGSTSTATRCGRIPIPATPRIAGHSRETPSSTGPRDGIKHGCATTVNPAATTVSRSWHGSVDPRSIGTTTTGRRPRRAGTSTEATSNCTRSERKRQRVARAGATPFSGACRLDLETLKRPPVTPARGDRIAHEDGRGGDGPRRAGRRGGDGRTGAGPVRRGHPGVSEAGRGRGPTRFHGVPGDRPGTRQRIPRRQGDHGTRPDRPAAERHAGSPEARGGRPRGRAGTRREGRRRHPPPYERGRRARRRTLPMLDEVLSRE